MVVAVIGAAAEKEEKEDRLTFLPPRPPSRLLIADSAGKLSGGGPFGDGFVAQLASALDRANAFLRSQPYLLTTVRLVLPPCSLSSSAAAF